LLDIVPENESKDFDILTCEGTVLTLPEEKKFWEARIFNMPGWAKQLEHEDQVTCFRFCPCVPFLKYFSTSKISQHGLYGVIVTTHFCICSFNLSLRRAMIAKSFAHLIVKPLKVIPNDKKLILCHVHNTNAYV
jgi:hypothetical protein